MPPLISAQKCLWLLFTLMLTTQPAWAETQMPTAPFSEANCIECHEQRDPQLITQWREGPHGTTPGAGCQNCHGDNHNHSVVNARKDESCSKCHEGPTSHSYTTSKHGVINRIDKQGRNRNHPLKRGNYRAPGCAYCHLHDSDHGNTMLAERGPQVRQWICSGCHSPRYVRELFASSLRQLAIADLKMSEGEALISATGDTQENTQTERLSSLWQSMVLHRQNILLGTGHQSPDYQWWYGQPALDGDLIHIRDTIDGFSRNKRVLSPSSKSPKPGK